MKQVLGSAHGERGYDDDAAPLDGFDDHLRERVLDVLARVPTITVRGYPL